MASYRLALPRESPRPFFAEVPYYLWGEVNYDSDGNCRTPIDQTWTELLLTHRDTDEQIEIALARDLLTIEGDNPAAARAASFFVSRCKAIPTADFESDLGNWDHAQAAHRARLVRDVFERPELVPFAVGHWFWGSWKWIGWFGTQFTWVGRWIMDAVMTSDPRGVNLCAECLREGTAGEEQSVALRYALSRLTGLSFANDREWVDWYFSGPGLKLYPVPDFDRWYADLKSRREAEEAGPME